jgi:hypothetical protein
MLASVSSLVNTNWYLSASRSHIHPSPFIYLIDILCLAIPFNQTIQPRLGIAKYAPSILGDRLIGLQVGAEPDMYASEGLRPYVSHYLIDTAVDSRF